MGQRRFTAERCPECRVHPPLCVCAQRPRLRLSTHLLIVQNNKERNKPTNTGRMLMQVVEGSEIVRFGVRDETFDASVLERPEREYLLLFPRVGDPEGPLPEPTPILGPHSFERPDATPTVVILDGTWAQCSRMSRRLPQLATMPAVALPEGPPSHWGVRTPSEPSRISTYEAAVRVVELLEGPERAGTMQAYFDRVAAAMLYMKAKLRSPEVPPKWCEERRARFGGGAT